MRNIFIIVNYHLDISQQSIFFCKQTFHPTKHVTMLVQFKSNYGNIYIYTKNDQTCFMSDPYIMNFKVTKQTFACNCCYPEFAQINPIVIHHSTCLQHSITMLHSNLGLKSRYSFIDPDHKLYVLMQVKVNNYKVSFFFPYLLSR